jgi:F-type H+-transporting ATPase subunit beta
MANVGKVKQIIGAVIDVQFEGTLPDIYNALELKKENGSILVLRYSTGR